MSDIKLDDGPPEDQAGWASVYANVFNVAASDLILDSPNRRSPGGDGMRRALVHNQSDGLSINFNGDYPGGVHIEAASVNLHILRQSSSGEPKLPKGGAPGDVLFVHQVVDEPGRFATDAYSLWICVGLAPATDSALWRAVPLGDSVVGTT